MSTEFQDSRYVTVIIRARLGEQDRLLNGELVDMEGTTLSRFSGWEGLEEALRSCLVLKRGTT